MANEMNFLPSLGMTGYYTLASPYDSQINPTVLYECVGVVSIAGYVAQGGDALNDVYILSGDTAAHYNSDSAKGVSLITITGGDGDLVVFPSSALLKVPDADGIIYRNVVLGISLSAVPLTMDLTVLQTQISDLVYNTLGVRSTTFATTIGAETRLTSTQDTAVRAARAAAVTNASNTLYSNGVLTAQNTAMQTQVNLLNSYIAAHLV